MGVADRKSQHGDCPLTFSGLLNGLDGMGSRDGMIVVMTTNFVDRLDPALVRSGRVTMPVRFTHATDGQLRATVQRFRPRRWRRRRHSSTALSRRRAAPLPG